VSDGTIERSAYFDVACCPANLARLMEQIPGLVYAQREADLFVNLFVGSTATIRIGGGGVAVTQETAYPWDGRVVIHVDPASPSDFTLAVRVPGWSRGEAMPTDLYRFAEEVKADATAATPALSVNGKPVALALDKGFARVRRRWRKGDIVQLDLPMPVRRVLAHASVEEDRGRAAIQRGPIVYCLESADHAGAPHITELRLPLDAPLTHAFNRDLLNGVEIIKGEHVVAVPYYAWNNRGKGEMSVWIPY
jgi:hypothetical protein